MSKNMGGLDRGLRIIVGIILIALPYLGLVPALDAGILRWIAQIVGVVFVATSAIGVCPLYPIIGLRTNKSE